MLPLKYWWGVGKYVIKVLVVPSLINSNSITPRTWGRGRKGRQCCPVVTLAYLARTRLIRESLQGLLHNINLGLLQFDLIGRGGDIQYNSLALVGRSSNLCTPPKFGFDQSRQRMKMSSLASALFWPAESCHLDDCHRWHRAFEW